MLMILLYVHYMTLIT